MLWTGAAVLLITGDGRVDLFGKVKGTDFVHFYTLGHVAAARDTALLYDTGAQHDRQVELVPESRRDSFRPVYPPTVAVLFVPLATLPYGAALAVWMLVTAAAYAGAIAIAWRHVRAHLPDGRFVAIAAAGFPPFWNLVLHGQTTIIPIVGFVGGWWACERSRFRLAGAALGLLAMKPTFGILLAPLLLIRWERRMLEGLAASIAAQVLIVAAVLGPTAWVDYAAAMTSIGEVRSQIEPKPYQLHSITTMTDLLPDVSRTPAWILVTGLFAVAVMRAWRACPEWSVRFGILVLAAALVNPHLTIYDATVIAPALIWIGAWQLRARPPALEALWPVTYALVVCYLIPTAGLVLVQASTFVLAWIVMRAARAARWTAGEI